MLKASCRSLSFTDITIRKIIRMRNDRFTGQPRYFDRKCGPLLNGHHAKCLRQFAGQI